LHDELQVIGPVMQRLKAVRTCFGPAGRAAAVVVIAGSTVLLPAAAAAERDPALEAAQAQCIQEGMLRGFSGETLRNFVSICAQARRNAPPRDLKPFDGEPGAC
jgi:hypothetical protein